MTNRVSRKQFLSLAALSSAAWAGAGCARTTTSHDRETGRVVRLAYFPNVTHAPALYGTRTGLFARKLAGIATVKELVFNAGPAEIEALYAGEVDLGYIGPGPALNGYLKSKGEALQILAGASSGGVALVARAGTNIRSIRDLDGRRVAVPQTGGTQDLSLRHALRVAGLTPRNKGGSVDVFQYAPSDILNQFRRGQLDAAWLPEPWVARMEEIGASVVLDEKTLWPGGRFSTTVLIGRTEYLRRNPDVVAGFVSAHEAAIQAINNDRRESRKIIGERIAMLNHGKGLSEAVLEKALARTEFTADLLKESVLTFADWSREVGYLRTDRTALANLFAPEWRRVSEAASSRTPRTREGR